MSQQSDFDKLVAAIGKPPPEHINRPITRALRKWRKRLERDARYELKHYWAKLPPEELQRMADEVRVKNEARWGQGGQQ